MSSPLTVSPRVASAHRVAHQRREALDLIGRQRRLAALPSAAVVRRLSMSTATDRRVTRLAAGACTPWCDRFRSCVDWRALNRDRALRCSCIGAGGGFVPGGVCPTAPRWALHPAATQRPAAVVDRQCARHARRCRRHSGGLFDVDSLRTTWLCGLNCSRVDSVVAMSTCDHLRSARAWATSGVTVLMRFA